MKNEFKPKPVAENKGITEIYRLLEKHSMLLSHLAISINVQGIRISEILNGKRKITADTDLRLCKFFQLTDGHFLNLQTQYDLALTKHLISDKLSKIKTIKETAIS